MSELIRCHYCPRVTLLEPAGARYAGWRMFSGLSLTNKVLNDVICPRCSGRGQDPGIPSWDVKCTDCKWQFMDSWDANSIPIINAKEAEQVALLHLSSVQEQAESKEQVWCGEDSIMFMDDDGVWLTWEDPRFVQLVNE